MDFGTGTRLHNVIKATCSCITAGIYNYVLQIKIVIWLYRLEMYCRDLTKKFDDVYIVSGPVMMPHIQEDGKKKMIYEVQLHIILMFSTELNSI